MLDALLSLLESLGCLWIGFSECLHVGVVFFPSLPFMGVMLFLSSWLGNASREWGLVRPSPPTPHSLFLLSLSSVPIFFSSSPPSCLLFIMSFSFVSLPLLFFFFFFFFFSINSFLFQRISHFLFQRTSHFFFLRGSPVLCLLKALLVLYVLRELLLMM